LICASAGAAVYFFNCGIFSPSSAGSGVLLFLFFVSDFVGSTTLLSVTTGCSASECPAADQVYLDVVAPAARTSPRFPGHFENAE